ncbi:MAG: aminoacyl-tRNA hydrolase [Chloroflexi bacterium]|nr:aminoacyl-tRNA hydrolase [Chloroflexota bacterium]
MKLLVGLGNPGATYARTRHNAGARCLEYLAARSGIPMAQRSRHALLGQGILEGAAVVLARPRTYMNLSGEAARYLVDRFGVRPPDLLVLCDDMDLPLGKLRIRPSGSAGGHNGMRSVIAALGNQEFPRLRVGIGRPPQGLDEVTYVLGHFTPEEEAVMQGVMPRVADAVACILREGLAAAMNRFN